MPIINIDWIQRTAEQKSEISRKFTETMVEVTGCPPEAVTIIFTDHSKDDVAKAGVLMSKR